MRKYLKIILIVIIVLVGVILVDTLQARVLKKSPIISWKEELSDDDSWVDRGILMDTYYCTKEKDIITVNWSFKTSKFTCPVDNISINYLSELQNEITNILAKKGGYDNFSSIYVDEVNKVVVIELVNNTEEERNWFSKNIMDSVYIVFRQVYHSTATN